MAIVTFFYVAVNFVAYGTINWQQLSQSSIPLVLVGSALMGSIGAIIMTIGALASVSGVDESGILGTSRLSYAMSIDGLFPKIFSKVHKKFKTPYMALIIQGIIAFFISIFSGVGGLISFSIFNLAFSFLLVCLSLIVIKKNRGKGLYGQDILPLVGIIICLYLLYSTSFLDKVAGLVVILAGIPLYVFFTPKTSINNLKKLFVSEEAIFERRLERKEKFLANFISLLHRIFKKINNLI